jgi:hypothetical protein
LPTMSHLPGRRTVGAAMATMPRRLMPVTRRQPKPCRRKTLLA